jgi:hypothetical protein
MMPLVQMLILYIYKLKSMDFPHNLTFRGEEGEDLYSELGLIKCELVNLINPHPHPHPPPCSAQYGNLLL